MSGRRPAPWLAEYLHELAVFRRGKRDDQVDATALFLDWLKQPMWNQGIFDFDRQLAEEALRQRAASDRPVRLRAPPGISHVQPFGGPARPVAAGGTVEMTEAQAERLLRQGWARIGAGDAL